METIISYFPSFFAWLFQTTLIASVVICLILLIQKTLGGKLGPRWCHALWLVLLIRMVMPWAPSSRISLFNLIPSWNRQIQPQQLPETAEQEKVSLPAQASDATEAIPVRSSEPDASIQNETLGPKTLADIESEKKPLLASLRRFLPVLWLSGLIVIGAYLLMSNFALWRIVKCESPLINQEMLGLFEECKAQMGVQSLVAVVPSRQIRSPGLFGFVRPRLLLPREMLDTATREEMRYVFLHELAHLRRHDIYLGWLTSLLQVLHWFNPLIWFAFYRMRADRELACDALVLTRTGQDKSHEYGGAIVGLLRRFSRSRPLPAMAGILENRSQLKRRMAMIAEFNKNSYKWSPLAAILIIILACISLPDARHIKASETSAAKHAHQSNFMKIWIPTKPGNGVLSPDGNKLAFVSEGSVWVVPVHGKVSPDIAGEPVRLTESMGAWDVASFITWSADGNWIAFNASDEKKDAIYVIPSSGGAPKKVPVEPRLRNSVYNYHLSLSPDGKIIAFSSRYIEKSEAEPPREPGGLPSSVRGFFIYTVSVERGEVKRLTDTASGEPAFSPDGKKIAFVKYYTSEKGELCGSLWVVPAVGGSSVQVIDSDVQGQAGGPIWSPNGKMIAFTSRASQEERRKEIYIVPVSETGRAIASPTKIELPLTTNDMLAGWTPDNKIGVFLHNPDPWAIYTISASGSKPVQVTTSGWATHPQWSPDGKRIYFRWGGGAIASVPSHGGKLTLVRIQRDPPVGLVYPGSGNAVSPDGQQIVFCGGGNIHTVPVEGGEPKKITQGRYPCWSPDGKSIAFIRSNQRPTKRESGWNIYIIPSKGGDVRRITFEPDNISRTHIDWSPDGKSIAYFAKDKTIRIAPVQGGEHRIVATVEELRNHDELAWSPDGTKLVYSSKGSIWVVSPDGGEAEEIETGLDAKAGHVSWSPDGKKLAFTAIQGGEEELWLMENFLPETPVAKPEPTMLRKVTYPWGGYATISPDGRYMCDVDWDVNWETDTEKLVLRELATGRERFLTTTGHPEYSAISRTSKQVAYLWHDPNWVTPSLFTVGFDGSDRRCIRQGDCLVPKDWSADGKEILAIESDKNPKQLVWVSTADGSLKHIVSVDKGYPAAEGHPGKFNVSPDGRFIAYDRLQTEDARKRDVFLFDLQNNGETVAVNHPANDRLLSWTPDGTSIFFASDRTGTWDGWLQRVADGEPQGFPQLVRRNMGDVTPIGFAQGGSFYYQTGGKPMRDVFIVALDLDKGQVLTSPVPVHQTGKSHFADWSPDGRKLAYCTGRPEESKIIHIRDMATGEEREIDTELPQFLFPHWSADGRSILGTTGREPPHSIYKIDVQTGERIDLVRSTTGRFWECELFPDGKTLLYSRDDTNSKTTRFVVRDLTTGREQDLIRTARHVRLGRFALSPDKQLLAYITLVRGPVRSQALMIVPATGGKPRELLQFDESEKMWLMSVAWMPDSQDVLFAKWLMEDKGGELWRISTEGGEPRKLWAWKKPFTGLCVHPDGQRIAFHTSTATNEMWVMEHFLPQDMGK